MPHINLPEGFPGITARFTPAALEYSPPQLVEDR
jgi:hypothetical protein